MTDVVITAAKRTPVGSFLGAFATTPAHELGRVPRRGESVTIGGLVFSVMLARGGAVRWFKVTRAAEEALGSDGA